MNDYMVRTPEQLPAFSQGFRKQAGLTQAEAALRLGVTPRLSRCRPASPDGDVMSRRLHTRTLGFWNLLPDSRTSQIAMHGRHGHLDRFGQLTRSRAGLARTSEGQIQRGPANPAFV